MARALRAALAVAAAGCSGAVLPPTPGTAASPGPMLAAINNDYVETIKPIFDKSCLSCHGAGKALPWYHALPGARTVIDGDIAKARRSVDMSHDFPFRGRGTPTEYLDAIKEAVEEGSMPPLRYRLLHSAAGLSAAEKKSILSWVAASRERLERDDANARSLLRR